MNKVVMKDLIIRKSPKIVFILILLIVIIVFLNRYFPLKLIDFSVYWSAGSLVLEGKNPYDTNQMFIKQGSAVQVEQNASMLQYWYPPWSLPLAILVGTLSFQTSQFIWYISSIGVILFCAISAWKFYSTDKSTSWITWVLPFTFAPVIFALFFGQISPFILLGITGFLLFNRMETPKADLISGLFLVLAISKPTTIYLLWPAIFIWSIFEKRYKVLFGFALGMVCSILICIFFRPNILVDYWQFLKYANVLEWKVPTIGYWLRISTVKNLAILQYIPLAIGIVGILLYWIRQRKQWIWVKEISWISFFSLILTVFAWTHDQVIVIPAIIESAALLMMKVKSTQGKIYLLLVWIAFNITIFALHLYHDDSWFFWQAPVLLLAYVLLKYKSRSLSPFRV